MVGELSSWRCAAGEMDERAAEGAARVSERARRCASRARRPSPDGGGGAHRETPRKTRKYRENSREDDRWYAGVARGFKRSISPARTRNFEGFRRVSGIASGGLRRRRDSARRPQARTSAAWRSPARTRADEGSHRPLRRRSFRGTRRSRPLRDRTRRSAWIAAPRPHAGWARGSTSRRVGGSAPRCA